MTDSTSSLQGQEGMGSLHLYVGLALAKRKDPSPSSEGRGGGGSEVHARLLLASQ